MDGKFFVGLGLSAVSFFLRYAVKDMPRPIAWLGVVFGVLIMVASTTPSISKYLNGPLIMLAVGCFCVIGSALWYYLGDFSAPALAEQTAQAGPSATQNNQSGPNIIAPGGKFNFYNQPQSQATDGVITQAGVVVGKVFGGRRSPNDATVFEFVEITNANQFNPTQPFQFNGVTLLFQSTRSRVGLNIARPDAGMTYGGVVAKVID
jgi:hypothetical protein